MACPYHVHTLPHTHNHTQPHTHKHVVRTHTPPMLPSASRPTSSAKAPRLACEPPNDRSSPTSTSEWRSKRSPGSLHSVRRQAPASATPSIIKRMARRRAQKRWSALVGAPNSRIARHMRPMLGEQCWAAFVAHANSQYQRAFISAFECDLLCCMGGRDGHPCPHRFTVDMTSPSAFLTLEQLHLDHEQDVRVTCDMWQRALP